MNEKLYAFWKYDQYPYLLGGTITQMRDDGTVETEQHGKNMFFKPVKIVPLKAGLIMNQALRDLASERRLQLADVEREMKRKLDKIFIF